MRTRISVFLITLSGLILEVGLTRIYSASIWYHFAFVAISRSEEHTSELQSQSNLVCRLLLEKKKINENQPINFPLSRSRDLSSRSTRVPSLVRRQSPCPAISSRHRALACYPQLRIASVMRA